MDVYFACKGTVHGVYKDRQGKERERIGASWSSGRGGAHFLSTAQALRPFKTTSLLLQLPFGPRSLVTKQSEHLDQEELEGPSKETEGRTFA